MYEILTLGKDNTYCLKNNTHVSNTFCIKRVDRYRPPLKQHTPHSARGVLAILTYNWKRIQYHSYNQRLINFYNFRLRSNPKGFAKMIIFENKYFHSRCLSWTIESSRVQAGRNCAPVCRCFGNGECDSSGSLRILRTLRKCGDE